MDQNTLYNISQLLLKQLRSDLSDAEQDELKTWIGEDVERQELVARLNDPAQLQQLMQAYVRRQAQMDAQLKVALFQ